jgi:PadR family transcriptional regulator PadR
LEKNGNVKSAWETGDGGPARRVYKLTREGEKHLEEWAAVLENLSKSMARFAGDVRRNRKAPAPRRTRAA